MTVAILGACASGCSTLDVGQVIALVPGDELGDDEVRQLERAAGRWNSHFGTQLEVTDAGEHQQEVGIYHNDLICSYATGRTEVTLPVEVHICIHHLRSTTDDVLGFGGFEYLDTSNLFLLLLHELGHVLNIRVHADDPEAVMYEAASYSASHGGRFSSADEALFYEANPGFDW